MDDSAAFYKTFFQYDTLFRVEEHVAAENGEQEKAAELILSAKATPVPPQQEVVAVVASTEVSKEIPPAATPPIASETAQRAIQFPALQHRILVLVDEKKQEELLPSDALLLENILKATGHSITETDILNFRSLPTADARAVLSTKSTNYFITFGVPLIKLQLDLLLPPYTPKYIEGIWFLLADPLSVIDANKELKKRLWLALQQMFKVG
jgi:predicted nucleic acid-binding protein